MRLGTCVLCGLLWAMGLGVVFGQRPSAGSQRNAAPLSAEQIKAFTAVYRKDVLLTLLSPEEWNRAQRLDGALTELFAETRLAPGKTLDVANYKIGGLTPYGAVFVLHQQVPIVDITVIGDLPAAEKALRALPKVTVLGVASTPAYRLISAAVPPERLLEVAGISGVRQMNASGCRSAWAPSPEAGAAPKITEATPQLAVLSQGVASNQAEQSLDVDDVRRVFGQGIDGTGVEVGTLSDSANQKSGRADDDGRIGISESQYTGDLPDDSRILLQDDYTGSNATDEGRAMMELIYDMAPGVDRLGFATAFKGLASFASNITTLGAAGMEIMTDDVVGFDEPVYQDGVVAQAVNSYVDGGGIYFSSGGNFANNSYEATWNNPDQDGYYNFPNGEVMSITVGGNANLIACLYWAQPWGNASSDLQVEVWDSTVQSRLAYSTDSNVGGNPYDGLVWKNSSANPVTVKMAVYLNSGLQPDWTFKIIFFDGVSSINQYTESAAGTLTPHAGTPKSIALGAAPYWNRDVPEGFSSQGPHKRFFLDDGTPIAPVTFEKPDFLSIDGCDTSFFGGDADGNGLPNFFGTSAAAPNAAAVAALMLQAAGGPGTLTQEDIRTLMRMTAIDLGPAGHDLTYGYGRINALGAVVAATGPLLTEYFLYPNQFGHVETRQTFSDETDIDCFKFAMGSSGATTIQVIDSDPAVNPMLAVFNLPTSAFLGVDYDSGSDDAPLFSFDPSTSNLYLVETLSESPFATLYAPYRLAIHGQPEADVIGLTVDTFGVAFTSSGNLFGPSDLDYYQATAPADTVGGVTGTLVPSGFDGLVILFDSAGNELARGGASNGVGTVDTATYASAITPGNTIVAGVVSSRYSGGGNFSLYIDFDNCPNQPPSVASFPDPLDRVVRPNPVTGQYFPPMIALSGGQLGTALWVPDSSSVTMEEVLLLDMTDSITAGLYSTSPKTRVGYAGPGAQTSLSATVVPEAQYVYRLYGAMDNFYPSPPSYLGINAAEYCVESPAPAALLTPIALSTTPPTAQGTYSSLIGPVGDNDYVEIQVPSTSDGTLTLLLDIPSDLDGVLQLFDSLGTLLASKNDSGSQGDETLVYNSVTPLGVYYVLIKGSADFNVSRGDGNQVGQYTLTVQLGLVPPTPSPSPSPSPSPTPTPSPSPTPISLIDTDGDGFTDQIEERYGSNPLDPSAKPSYGDYTLDNMTDVRDAVVLYRDTAGSPFRRYNARYDVNLDSRVNTQDALIIYRWALKIPPYWTLPWVPLIPPVTPPPTP